MTSEKISFKWASFFKDWLRNKRMRTEKKRKVLDHSGSNRTVEYRRNLPTICREWAQFHRIVLHRVFLICGGIKQCPDTITYSGGLNLPLFIAASFLECITLKILRHERNVVFQRSLSVQFAATVAFKRCRFILRKVEFERKKVEWGLNRIPARATPACSHSPSIIALVCTRTYRV